MLDFGSGLRQFLDVAADGDFHGCDVDAPSIEWLRSSSTLPSPSAIWRCRATRVRGTSPSTSPTRGPRGSHHRVLKPDGRLFITFLGPGMMEPLIGETCDEDRIGMNSLFPGCPWSLGGTISFP